jgi:hypothetical protein
MLKDEEPTKCDWCGGEDSQWLITLKVDEPPYYVRPFAVCDVCRPHNKYMDHIFEVLYVTARSTN